MLRKRGRVWYFQAQINGKKVTWSTGEVKKGRAEEVAKLMAQQAKLLREQPVGSPKTLSEAIVAEVDRIEADVSELQAKRASAALRDFRDWLGRDVTLSKITDSLVERYQRARLQVVAKWTVQKELCFIIRLLRANGFQVNRPSPKAGKTTPNRAFTEKELVDLFSVTTPRYLALYLVLLATGARPAELVYSRCSQHKPLLKSEIDWDSNTLTLRAAKQRRGARQKVRKVQVDDITLDALRKEVAETPENWVFAFRPGNKLARDFDATLKRAGIEKLSVLGEKLTLHSFRHTYATFIGEALGANPFLVQAALGHSQISTSAHYCHITAPKIVPIEALKLVSGGEKSGNEDEGGVKGRCQREKAAG